MKKKVIIISSSIGLIILIGAGFLFHFHQMNKNNTRIIEYFDNYLKLVHQIERHFVEKLPVYHDFATPQKELELRKYLIGHHFAAVKTYDVQPIKTVSDIQKYKKEGKLKKLEIGKKKLYYFYNVRKKFRYLAPHAKKGLETLTKRFKENINKRIKSPPVKIAISSVIRPDSYQKKLFKNYYYMSTHSYGSSFDIFFDDYFVYLPSLPTIHPVSITVRKKLHRKLGFLLGDALRRQFRSILMETLLQLQKEGLLYAILEKNQRCYHITVLKRK